MKSSSWVACAMALSHLRVVAIDGYWQWPTLMLVIILRLHVACLVNSSLLWLELFVWKKSTFGYPQNKNIWRLPKSVSACGTTFPNRNENRSQLCSWAAISPEIWLKRCSLRGDPRKGIGGQICCCWKTPKSLVCLTALLVAWGLPEAAAFPHIWGRESGSNTNLKIRNQNWGTQEHCSIEKQSSV